MGIDQFLLSYWWLVLLLFVGVMIITRNVIKFLITSVVLVVLLFLFWEMFVSSGFSKSTKCFTDEAEVANSTYETAKSMKPGEERNSYICAEDQASFTRLVACFNDSRKENKLAFAIYSGLPKFAQTINETIESHNKTCLDSLLEQPVFSDK